MIARIGPGRVLAVSVGRAGTLSRGSRSVESAFAKHTVGGPVPLRELGFDGDEQVYETHGGPDKAVLVYSRDNYGFWIDTYGLVLPTYSAFGENLTVVGLPETDVFLGDVFRLGDATVQVTEPRAPCFKHSIRYGVTKMAIYMQRSGRTGYLLRVLEEGAVQAGDTLVLESRKAHGITVAEANRIINVDRKDLDGARRLLTTDRLPQLIRDELTARLRAHGFGADVERLYYDQDDAVSVS